jgi:hypothetical protein
MSAISIHREKEAQDMSLPINQFLSPFEVNITKQQKDRIDSVRRHVE